MPEEILSTLLEIDPGLRQEAYLSRLKALFER